MPPRGSIRYDVDDTANAVAFLASVKAQYITGTRLLSMAG
jgi:hypothetical protein